MFTVSGAKTFPFEGRLRTCPKWVSIEFTREMSATTPTENANQVSKHLNRLKIAAVVMTSIGIALFAYFVYAVGVREILAGIGRIGIEGFAVVLFIYFLRMIIRGWSWGLAVHEPYSLKLRDTVPAVIIGEALSSIIPLGFVISGTSKAVAVTRRVPLVVGLSSIATENLIYSFATGIFVAIGGIAFLRSFDLTDGWKLTIDILLGAIFLLLFFGVLMVIRQWHFASATCDWLYDRGHLKGLLEHGRFQVRLFENLIYGFYRRYPQRFIPILGGQVVFHALGVAEVMYLLWKLGETPSAFSAMLLESVSRLITIVFKLVPFLIGVDEAGAQFVTDALAIGTAVGVTLAILRKGRILFWAVVGVLLVAKRGLSLADFRNIVIPKAHE